MKKFYTLLSAALLATGLLSAAQLKTAKLNSAQLTTVAENAGKAEVKAIKFEKIAKAPNRIKDPNEPATTLDPTGVYVAFDINDQGRPSNSMGTMEIVADGEDYKIIGMLGEDNEIPAKLGKSTVTDQQGKPTTIDVLTIPAAGQVTLFSEEGVDYKIWLVGYNDKNQFVRYSNEEINLEIDETGFYWLYNAFLGAISDEGQGYNLGTFNAFKSNAIMECKETSSYDQQTIDATYQMAYYMPNETSIMMLNFAGFGGVVTFNINNTNATATATNVKLGSASDNAGNRYDIVAGNTLESTDLTGNLSLVSENTLALEIPGTWYAYISAQNQVQEMYHFTNTVITLDPEDPNAGLNDVIADSDVNAPFEYYNLQGMRVANPEAGQLVIKRQGKTVSKIVVR